MMRMGRSRDGAGRKLDGNLVRKLDLGLRHGPLQAQPARALWHDREWVPVRRRNRLMRVRQAVPSCPARANGDTI
jgi:hypothetical protein